MKLIFPVIVLLFFAVVSSPVLIEAQISAPGSGTVPGKNPASSTNRFDIGKVDFKNFTYPILDSGNTENTYTLRNGVAGTKGNSPYYALRKTYYFDLTGDKKYEAITHIIAEGCQMGCGLSSLFYIYTVEQNKPRLLWKIAVGGNEMGGLKKVNFDSDEIILEVFGDCSLEGWLIKPYVDIKKNPKLKTSSYTRFVFSRAETGFTQTSKVILPLMTKVDFSAYRTQISFGK